MEKLLIINRAQFGYHIDTYYYCKYLRKDFDITYIGFELKGNERIVLDDIYLIYVSRRGNIISRYLRFLKEILIAINNHHYEIVFINYFLTAGVIKVLLPNTIKIVLDIRSGAVRKNETRNYISNKLLLLETLLFSHITMVSESLRKKIGVSKKKAHILPLGADTLSKKNKSFNRMDLLYVGTLNNRQLIKTIDGFYLFYKEYKDVINMSYKIIGAGKEASIINERIGELKLNKVVSLIGYKTHEQLPWYFDRSNFGVSFIPQTVYYDCQPPTKIFEYVLSGMACIATNTHENSKLINDTNGVICKDTSLDFYNALTIGYKRRNSYNSERIRNSLMNYHWKDIVHDNLRKYLTNIIEQ